jgi:hypothetical protein
MEYNNKTQADEEINDQKITQKNKQNNTTINKIKKNIPKFPFV